MKAEKVILSFIAIIVGLVAAGAAFYFYQMTKTIPDEQKKPIAVVTEKVAEPTPEEKHILTIDSPKDEEVFTKKLITIKGKTEPESTIMVSTETADEVVMPAANGTFSLTQTIPNGTTQLEIVAIFPNGEEEHITRTVTFSTEEF